MLTWLLLLHRGKLYGSFEAKTLFLIAVALFEIGSAICGAAPTMNALIVGRYVNLLLVCVRRELIM